MLGNLTVAVDVGGTFTDLVAYSHSTKGLFRVRCGVLHGDPS
jgi:N-methylhydantoinase A/oxoprolinase/acetone carboxylase beta subunit